MNTKQAVYLTFEDIGEVTAPHGGEACQTSMKHHSGALCEFSHFLTSGDAAAYAKAQGIPPTNQHMFKRSWADYLAYLEHG